MSEVGGYLAASETIERMRPGAVAAGDAQLLAPARIVEACGCSESEALLALTDVMGAAWLVHVQFEEVRAGRTPNHSQGAVRAWERAHGIGGEL